MASVSGGFLGQLLRAWRTSNPGVALEFKAALPHESVARILARQLDVAIVTGSRSTLDYSSETLWFEEVFAAITDQHVLAGRDRIELAELWAERFLVTRHPLGPEIHDWILSRLSGPGFRPIIEEHDVGRDTLFSLAGLGFGVTLASTAETTIRYPNLSFVKVSGEQLPFSFIWSAQNDNPALRRFLSDARALSGRWAV